MVCGSGGGRGDCIAACTACGAARSCRETGLRRQPHRDDRRHGVDEPDGGRCAASGKPCRFEQAGFRVRSVPLTKSRKRAAARAAASARFSRPARHEQQRGRRFLKHRVITGVPAVHSPYPYGSFWGIMLRRIHRHGLIMSVRSNLNGMPPDLSVHRPIIARVANYAHAAALRQANLVAPSLRCCGGGSSAWAITAERPARW